MLDHNIAAMRVVERGSSDEQATDHDSQRESYISRKETFEFLYNLINQLKSRRLALSIQPCRGEGSSTRYW